MKIGFIGAGNMASAIIGGLILSGTEPDSLYAFDITADKLSALGNKGVIICADTTELVDSCDIIVLAVKPQNYSEVLFGVKDTVSMNKTFVSIAAGITIDFIRRALGIDCPVVRVMPNTPLLLGLGASALCPSDNVSPEALDAVNNMFMCSGTVETLTEDTMNAVISVNGSSPAYIYLFAKAMKDYAVSQGIDSDKAMNLICATLCGSAEMLKSSGDDPDTLIKKVSSPGGTTIAAMDVLNKARFEQAIHDAMAACTNRAKELCAEA